MTAHTPGPWFVRSVDDGREPRVFVTREFGVNDAPRFYIAFIPSAGQGPKEAYPNAQLIAAAPDLLAVCQELYSAMHDYAMDVDEDPPYKHHEMMSRAAAAIAKAKGDQTV